MDMAGRILDKLRQSPFSVEEPAFDLKRKPSICKIFCELSVCGCPFPHRRTENSP